ncbi:hypothetical protein HN51_005390, partial [Arachis hypogaea]
MIASELSRDLDGIGRFNGLSLFPIPRVAPSYSSTTTSRTIAPPPLHPSPPLPHTKTPISLLS